MMRNKLLYLLLYCILSHKIKIDSVLTANHFLMRIIMAKYCNTIEDIIWACIVSQFTLYIQIIALLDTETSMHSYIVSKLF